MLSRLPITHHIEHDLSWKTCEARRMQRVDIQADGCALHLYNVEEDVDTLLGALARRRELLA